jgi:hypothetical protein
VAKVQDGRTGINFYLAYILAAESGKRETLEGLLTAAGIGTEGERPDVAARVLTIYKHLDNASK